MTKWKPIETLDHDDDVLMRCPKWGVVVACKLGEKYITGYEDVFNQAGKRIDFKPTLWCEIPT